MSATPQDLIQEASILTSWGLPTFPVARKRPRCKWAQFQHRRPSDREITRLFQLSGVDGIGVVPGPLSGGFAVRDYDDPEAYQRWADAHSEIARTVPTVQTGRGFHVWSRSTVPLYRNLGDGEFRGDGKHFCVVPPTRHPSGSEYKWLNGPPLGPSDFPKLDPLRAGLLSQTALLRSARPDIRHSSSLCPLLPSVSGRAEGHLPDAVRECVLRTLPTRAGQRNRQLHQFARALRDHIPDEAPPVLLYDCSVSGGAAPCR
jgi:hypothetical protein